MDNKDSSISQRNGEENVIFDNNDFNQNILNDQTNSPTPAQSTPTQILVANEQGQAQIVRNNVRIQNPKVTTINSGKQVFKHGQRPTLSRQSGNVINNQISIHQSSSNVKSALPAQVDALKRNSPQLNQHEDLRRRASYRRIYNTLDVSPANGQTETVISSYSAINNSNTAINVNSNREHSITNSQFPIPPINPVKTEIIPNPTNPSTDDTDSDGKMSPTTNLPQTVPIPAAHENQPVLVQLPSNPSSTAISYAGTTAGVNTQAAMTYGQLAHPSEIALDNYRRAYHGTDFGAELDSSSLADPTDLIPQGPVALVEEAARKREVRLLKNREAARECRRKKKEYIKCLENRVQVLESQNKALIDELKNLKEMYCHNQP